MFFILKINSEFIPWNIQINDWKVKSSLISSSLTRCHFKLPKLDWGWKFKEVQPLECTKWSALTIIDSKVRIVKNSYLPCQAQGSVPSLKVPIGHPNAWSLGRFCGGQENEMSEMTWNGRSVHLAKRFFLNFATLWLSPVHVVWKEAETSSRM